MTTLSVTIDTCPNCGADLSELKKLSTPPTFCLQCRFPIVLIANKYQLVSILGEGGFGTVYLARHVRLRRNAERVVKVIKPEVFARSSMEERFYREVQVTSDLSQRNEHIVRIYDDFGEVPQVGHFYVMEYLEGDPLTQYMLDPQQVQPLEWTLDIFGQLCDAIQAAHEGGIIHRDIKPDNILLIERRKNPYFVKVLDFGIAKPTADSGRTDSSLTQGALGTPMYMPPEQATNRPIDGRSDLYAMGIILYEMLTGHHPFIPPGQEHALTPLELLTSQLMHQPPSPRELRPDLSIPEALEQVVLKTLAKEPDNRYQSVEEFWQALQRAAPHTHAAKIAQTQSERPPLPTPYKTPSGNHSEALLPTMTPDLHEASPHIAGLPSGLSPTGEHLQEQQSAPVSTQTFSPRQGAVVQVDSPHTPPPNSSSTLGDQLAPQDSSPHVVPPPADNSALSRSIDFGASPPRTTLWVTLAVLLLVGGGIGLYASGLFTSPTQAPPQTRRALLGRAPVRARPRTPLALRPAPSDAAPDASPPEAPAAQPEREAPAPRRVVQRRHIRRRRRIRRRNRRRRRRARRRVVSYIAPRRSQPRVSPRPRPAPPSNGCPAGQTRLRIRSCPQGGGRFTLYIGNGEKNYHPRTAICIPKGTTKLGVEQQGCRDCIFRLPSGRAQVTLYLKDQNDQNTQLPQNYCRTP